MKRVLTLLLGATALVNISNGQTITEKFGTGSEQFTMDFVEVGNPNNPSLYYGNPQSVGSVSYEYRLGKYEVSREQIIKAGFGTFLQDMTAYGGNGNAKPATGINWYEAAQFVNYLNTSRGYSAAYKFNVSGALQLWTSAEAGYNAANLFRNTLAVYFLPNMDEWFKAGFYDPNKTPSAMMGKYWTFATGSDSMPIAVSSGTEPYTAVFSYQASPADVDKAGGLSPYGTMGQNGNVYEWIETAYDLVNNVPDEFRGLRGGAWDDGTGSIGFSALNSVNPLTQQSIYGDIGFRVAMIPEPTSLSLLALSGLALAINKRRRA
jgi:formylglycine-generating enzyme required for sulfatase activity